MRAIWLKNMDTGATWDLLPQNPYPKATGWDGCPLLGIGGMGYSQDITQNQVGVDYFVSKISTKNSDVTGTFLFWDDSHLEAFQNFVGDFRKQLMLFYSPSGEYEFGDQISENNIYRKPVIISKVSKTEKTEQGVYECGVTFSTQSDVWKRYVVYEKENVSAVGEPLVYPYTYTYVYGGRDTFEIDIPNYGRETGCKITITNTGDNVLDDIEWYLDSSYVDDYGVQHTDTQRSKWLLGLRQGDKLEVDSNATTQQASVIYNINGTSQNVVSAQEPSWDYINFVQLPHGQNRFVFYAAQNKVNVKFEYWEQKELI